MSIAWPQRARKLTVGEELFRQLFTQGMRLNHTVEKGLPKDVTLIDAAYDRQLGAVTLIFTHPDWDLVYSVPEAPAVEVAWGLPT